MLNDRLLGALAWGVLVCADITIRLGLSRQEWLDIASLARQQRES